MVHLRGMAVVLLLALLAVWLTPWGGVGQDQPTIRLGGTLAETGRLARTAALYVDGRNLAVDVINASGGVDVGGVAHRIELVQFDDQSDADLAVRLYQQLIEEENVHFLLGPYSSGLVIPTSAIAEQFQVPMVEGGAATMGLIYADDAFSLNVAEGARAWAEEYGLEIVADEKYVDGQTEFGSLIAKLKDANPDVIMGANHLAEMLAFVPQARSLGLNTDLVFTVGTAAPDFLALGDVAEGVFGVSPWLPTQDTRGDTFGSAVEYTQMFEDRFGAVPEYHNAAGTAEILIYKKAIEAVGTLDRDAVRAELASISFDSFYGTISFEDNGQIGTASTVIQVQEGVAVGVIGGVDPIFNLSQ